MSLATSNGCAIKTLAYFHTALSSSSLTDPDMEGEESGM